MLADLMDQTFLQNRIMDYLVFLSIFFGGMAVIQVVKGIILKRLRVWAAATATSLDDFLIRAFERNLVPILYFGVFYIGLKSLTLNQALGKGVDVLGAVVLTLYGVRLLIEVLSHFLQTYWLSRETDVDVQNIIRRILPAVKVLIWGAGIVFLLDNLGFKISALIAGLGIGGVAVALAAQAVLGDLFSYFAIFFDRPFKTGDFIIVGDYLGTVEHVGIKTTRIQSLGGEQLIFSNTDLTNSRVRNYKRMQKRRVVFKLGVTYQTPLEKLKEIPVLIKEIINRIDDTGFDRAHFFSYGDFSLVYEVVYYVAGSDYNKYMDIQQEINFAINEEFATRGIEFAYPTQTLYLSKTP